MLTLCTHSSRGEAHSREQQQREQQHSTDTAESRRERAQTHSRESEKKSDVDLLSGRDSRRKVVVPETYTASSISNLLKKLPYLYQIDISHLSSIAKISYLDNIAM